MCRVLRVQRSGYCAWKNKPKSDQALADEVMLVSIKRFFGDSHGICGSPRVHRDKVGVPATAAPDRLQRDFTVTQPNQVWVTGITHIRTDEGWLYVTVVIDLRSRRVVGWAMGASMATELVPGLMMAVWRMRPRAPAMIHSDQGSQFGSDDFNRWCKDNQLVPSMGRRVNSWDNGSCRVVLQQFEEGADQTAPLPDP
jgi:putative transposase